jgi:uncharacterized protein YyaL (SSP411 family)
MFLTPDALPFWGGTYFPPETKYGRPSFRHVLTEISRIWKQEREKITQNAEAISAALHQPRYAASPDQLSDTEIYQAADIIINATDSQYVLSSPKFQAPIFTFLGSLFAHPNEKAWDPCSRLSQISNGESMTIWPAELPATQPTIAGWRRISRRCSTTMPSM